jgi:hypothetical protein
MTLEEIKKQITDVYVANMAIAGYTVDPTTWSIVNIQRIIIFVVAYCHFILYKNTETTKAEIDETIANKTPHRLKWYANTVKAFQYGYNVSETNFLYDNSGLSDSAIAASKIVAYCAVTEEADSLNIKVAKDNGTDLEPLTNTELNSLRDYMENPTYGQKDAGVFLTFISDPADSLKLKLKIYYKPTILNDTGVEIATGAATVKNAIQNHLKNLPFNGVFALQTLVDVLQAVNGVEFVKLENVDVKADAVIDYSPVDVYYLPASGYLRIIDDADLTISFEPYAN